MPKRKLPTNFNNLIRALLTDKYQICMCYAYWRVNKHLDDACFDLFFRKNPFKGEYTIFTGLEECLKFLSNFEFKDEDIAYLKTINDLKHVDEEFWTYLKALNADPVKMSAMAEGSVCFPSVPLIRLEGPLGLLQLLETTLLNLINYASLVTTNAARYRQAVKTGRSPNCKLFEFGLRRAQGPDGGCSASYYTYVGGFDATSNLLAGMQYGLPVSGTVAHSFVISFFPSKAVEDQMSLLNKTTGSIENFTKLCFEIQDDYVKKMSSGLSATIKTERSELIAFITYACSFPDSFSVLVDTYDVIKSGLPNYCVVAIGLIKFGYKPIGVRIDSGDLAYLSRESRLLFDKVGLMFNYTSEFKQFNIIASNDINEETIMSLNEQNHSITALGIGTHLVTCQNQPALGCVYKLVETNGQPCMKLSSATEKTNLPYKKCVYRLYGRHNYALLDLIQLHDEPIPEIGKTILCRHPLHAEKRCNVVPSRVDSLLETWWADGELVRDLPTLEMKRNHCTDSLDYLTEDIKRNLNPTPYKVSVSEKLFNLLNELKISLTPIGELS